MVLETRRRHILPSGGDAVRTGPLRALRYVELPICPITPPGALAGPPPSAARASPTAAARNRWRSCSAATTSRPIRRQPRCLRALPKTPAASFRSRPACRLKPSATVLRSSSAPLAAIPSTVLTQLGIDLDAVSSWKGSVRPTALSPCRAVDRPKSSTCPLRRHHRNQARHRRGFRTLEEGSGQRHRHSRPVGRVRGLAAAHLDLSVSSLRLTPEAGGSTGRRRALRSLCARLISGRR